MNKAFVDYVNAIEPGGQAAVELEIAVRSPDALLALAQARGLDLSREDAVHFTSSLTGPLEDDALDGVSGGISFGDLLKKLTSPLAQQRLNNLF